MASNFYLKKYFDNLIEKSIEDNQHTNAIELKLLACIMHHQDSFYEVPFLWYDLYNKIGKIHEQHLKTGYMNEDLLERVTSVRKTVDAIYEKILGDRL